MCPRPGVWPQTGLWPASGRRPPLVSSPANSLRLRASDSAARVQRWTKQHFRTSVCHLKLLIMTFLATHVINLCSNTDGWNIVDRNVTKVTIDFDCFIAAEENQK